MRRLAMLAVGMLGCGGGSATEREVTATAEAEAEVEPVPSPQASSRLDLPAIEDADRVMVLDGARPSAVVWVDARGKLEVGEVGATWSLGAGDRTPTREDALREAVLDAIARGNGPHARRARRELELLRDATYQARRQAIAEARAAGVLGVQGASDEPGPGRLPAAPGQGLDQLDPLVPLVAATPSAPASRITKLLEVTGGALAVAHDGRLAVLDVAFSSAPDPMPGTAPWIEVSADAAGVHVVAQPDDRRAVVPWNPDGSIDRPRLEAAYRGAGALRVDLLTRTDTTAQALVELVAALRAIGAEPLAVANGPDTLDDRRAQIANARPVPSGGTLGRLTFDPPAGGGSITVRYPFVFQSAGP
jgi:hypothetical protein